MSSALDCLNFLLLVVALETVNTIYLPWKEESRGKAKEQQEEYEPVKKENQVYRHHESPDIRNDEDILQYVKAYGREVMIWRCRNAVKPYWDKTNAIPFVDLYCSVIGSALKVAWYHRNQKIDTEAESVLRKYERAQRMHYERGRLFAKWWDFRLRIHNVTRADSGAYLFEVSGPNEERDQQWIFVDVSTKWHKVNNKQKLRNKKKKRKETNMAWSPAFGEQPYDNSSQGSY